jgi:hypothetical protein
VAMCVVQVDVAGDDVIRHGRVLRGATPPPHVGGGGWWRTSAKVLLKRKD